ncbi:MAG: TIGR03936 family radical SAM-associated protein [Firmicutes bacterium]|nr:TIGR03936 family radical SAM-associated protein [Bacillota bacterium]
MILIKFTKKGSTKFISHIDLVRIFVYTINRAGLDVNYSLGFNPHKRIFFAPPLAVGVESEAEFCVIDTNEKATDFKHKFNKVSTQNIQIIKAKNIGARINLAKDIIASGFAVCTATSDQHSANSEQGLGGSEQDIECGIQNSAFGSLDMQEKIAKLLGGKSVKITYLQKGESVTKDVKHLIKDFSFADNKLHLVLSTGQENLRPDRLLNWLFKKLKITSSPQILKTKNFVLDGAKLKEFNI